MLRQAVCGSHHVGPQAQLRGTDAVARRRRSCLEPVQEAEADAFRVLQGRCGARCRNVENGVVAIVVPRPVEHRDVARRDAGKRGGVDQPAVGPERAFRAGHPLEEAVVEPPALLTVDLAAVHLDREAVGLRVPVALELRGSCDRVHTAHRRPLEGEGVRQALDATGLWLLGLGVRLARLRRRLRSHPVLDLREREEVAELGGVDHELRPEAGEPIALEVDGRHRRDRSVRDDDGDRLRPQEDADVP